VEIAGYEELLPLRTGASSDLYRAQLPASGRWVAIKIFRFAVVDDAAGRRFLRECELAKAVSSHLHVATLYDAGLTRDRQPYLTMELADGGSVADRLSLKSHGLFTPAEVAQIGAAVASALDAGHAAGAVHRSLQPTGILFADDGRPLVTELGVTLFAERWEAAGYLEDVVPYHASPEVLEREQPGPASDVYSLASTLYTMLAGTPPHQTEGVDSASSLLLRVLQQEPPSLVARGVPPALDTVLQEGLAAEPGRRTPTAMAFRQQLDEVLASLGNPDQRADPNEPDGPGPAGSALPVARGLSDHRQDYVDAGPLVDDQAMAPSARTARMVPAISSTGALEPVTKADADTDTPHNSRRWRRRALIVAGAGATVLLALAAEGLRPDDADPEPTADGGARPPREAPPVAEADQSPADENGPAAGPEAATDDGGADPPGELPVPTGLRASGSVEGGVQLDWDSSDTDSFAVLILSEVSPPRVETTDGPSLFIPAIDLSTDDGYCFTVARLDMVAGAPDGEASNGEAEGGGQGGVTDQIGPAFSSVVCIRGAAEDNIRTE
jgi:serine/threonine protein kinase